MVKIQHLVKIINKYRNFKIFQPKNYYIKLLEKKILYKYKYTRELFEKFIKLFPMEELVNFLLYNQKNRPLTIRVNLNKIFSRFLFANSFNKEVNIHWLKNLHKSIGVVTRSKVKISSTIEYLRGLCTVQSIPSFLTVVCTNPALHEKILDLAAAPGGKTSLMSQFMNNTGTILSNDIDPKRIKSLIANIHRLGVTNSIIVGYNGITLSKFIKGFDRVIIDAPCTGTGVIGHDGTIKFIKIDRKISIITRLQKKLLVSAIDMCNENSENGGIIIYSTCSILPEENECVIQHALNKRKIKIISTGLQFGMPGYKNFEKTKFNDDMSKCVRFFPHIHNTDGFFICKIKKLIA